MCQHLNRIQEYPFVLGYKMCRWMHSLRCFWEMGHWPIYQKKWATTEETVSKVKKNKKKQEWEGCNTQHKHFIWEFFSCCRVVDWYCKSDLIRGNWAVFNTTRSSASNMLPAFYCPSQSPYISAASAFVISWLMQMQSMFWFLLV